jgi:hypothetical protein
MTTYDEIKTNVDDADDNYTVLFGATNGQEMSTAPEKWTRTTQITDRDS